jgi:hypothetical protein
MAPRRCEDAQPAREAVSIVLAFIVIFILLPPLGAVLKEIQKALQPPSAVNPWAWAILLAFIGFFAFVLGAIILYLWSLLSPRTSFGR